MKKSSHNNLKIAIVDSGIDICRKEWNLEKIVLLNDCNDKIGHGTAVASIIHKLVPNANLYIYNLFAKTGRVAAVELIDVLKQICSSNHYDVIHLSCGIIASDCISELHKVIKEIFRTGTIFVAAFDNEGTVSYPAAFEEVIGVDWNELCPSCSQYIYVKNSLVNVLGTGSTQRLPWINGSYKYVAGSSFAAPHITSIVAQCIENGMNDYNEIISSIEKNAYQIWNTQNNKFVKKKDKFTIKKAIIYPFNKEIHCVAINHNSMPFEIYEIYESSLFRHVGKRVSDILKFSNNNLIIKNIQQVDWTSDFDTIILGHTKVYAIALKKDVIFEMLENCIRYNKNIYCLDPLDSYKGQIKLLEDKGCWAYSPQVDISDVDNSLMGKLYRVSTPVVGVFGTSPKQGKFTLQVALKNKMSEIGYKIGGIATEPTAKLFDFDFVYPVGYENNVHISGSKAIQTLNRFMHEIDQKQYDLIIVGSQSQTIPYNMGNVGHYPIYQQDIILGTEPDAIILCINPFDEVEYIKRTINYLENYIDTQVIALSLFPKNRELNWSISGSQSDDLTTQVINNRKAFYTNALDIPCLCLGNEKDLCKLIDCLIEFF